MDLWTALGMAPRNKPVLNLEKLGKDKAPSEESEKRERRLKVIDQRRCYAGWEDYQVDKKSKRAAAVEQERRYLLLQADYKSKQEDMKEKALCPQNCVLSALSLDLRTDYVVYILIIIEIILDHEN